MHGPGIKSRDQRNLLWPIPLPESRYAWASDYPRSGFSAPDAWFHLLEGSKNPRLDNRMWGPGQTDVFERMPLVRMLSDYLRQQTRTLGLQCFLQRKTGDYQPINGGHPEQCVSQIAIEMGCGVAVCEWGRK